MAIVEVCNVDMNYHNMKGVTEAIKDINFTVDEGEFISIIGPSGCGKSTLLNIISGLIEPSKGVIKYKGSIVKDNLDRVGYMFQKDYLFPWLTVKDNELIGLKIKKILTKENIAFTESLIERYGLKKFENHKPQELSGGMRQRAALIRTMALKPEILLLDEPFSALDYQTRQKVTDDVYGIIKSEGKTTIMVTHDIGEAIVMSSKVIVLSKRPASIKKMQKVHFENSELTPFEKRGEKEYMEYFSMLWKEFDDDNE